ncbi:T4 family baseplate hub assembly chaperone [Allokutzneria albata]|uniref:Phage baseplate protein n=1 Tax=Allokutzneria albata TaxID=211114 RepID=A0A1G9QYB5_ALLAB|nr:hypothetical protein [Allokutzneria albata]SDM15851.1 hypothetical protein SAMN04489726_0079 [Allokutzneria albata]
MIEVAASLAEAELLSLWENGSWLDTAGRALVLAEAGGGAEPGTAAELPIGERDAILLSLHESWFGRRLRCAVTCPSCQGRLETEVSTVDLRVPVGTGGPVSADGVELDVRPVSTADLLAARDRRALLLRCVRSARKGERAISPAELPEEVLEAVAAALPELDPQADVSLGMSCASCAHEWGAPFDIAGYLWAVLDTHARRLLYEIHELATAYGWTEREVLSVGPARRRFYLEAART